MARGKTTEKSGAAAIVVDQTALLKLLDRTADGAASNFVRVVTAELEERQVEAIRVWPVRSGRSRRSFAVQTRIREDVIEVAITNDAKSNWGFYAYKIRNSVRTRESLEREARDMIAVARVRVKARLKDPESAQFGEIVVRNNVVCGTVNSKNPFGGYTGPELFYAFGTLVYFDSDLKSLTPDEAKLPREMRATCTG